MAVSLCVVVCLLSRVLAWCAEAKLCAMFVLWCGVCRCVLTVLCMWELRREWQAFITLRHKHLMQHAPHL